VQTEEAEVKKEKIDHVPHEIGINSIANCYYFCQSNHLNFRQT
jgi:hypothetical protein